MKDVGIAVVGLGRIGYLHAQNVAQLPRAKLVAVCDQDERVVHDVAEELHCASYVRITEMLENTDVQAVCVATPTAEHVEPVVAVAQAGRPLFCEKPLASSLQNSLRLQHTIREAGIMCQVGFQRRFDPAHVEAQQLIRKGTIGRPVFINGFSRDPFPPPPWAWDFSKGGGLYVDFLLHDFDAARFFMQDEVDRVYADEANLVVDAQGATRFADNAVVSLRFKGGGLANYHASMHAEYGYDIRTEVYGSRGNIMVGGLTRRQVAVCTAASGISMPHTYQAEAQVPHFVVRFKEAYLREMAAFVDCILNDTPPSVTAEDAVKAQEIALAAAKSALIHESVTIAHAL